MTSKKSLQPVPRLSALGKGSEDPGRGEHLHIIFTKFSEI